jgi:hypothetical protein
MLALIGSAIGLLGALLPRLIGLFEAKQNHKQELELLNAQGKWQLDMATAGHAAKMAEITSYSDTARELAAFGAAARPSGIRFVDAINGLVRPLITFSLFALYAAVKVGTYILLEAGFASGVTGLWTEEDTAIWAAIITFWFGNRSLNKKR